MSEATKKVAPFEALTRWRYEVYEAIVALGRKSYLDIAGTEAMYHCNYKPDVAAREWLRQQLNRNPP